MSDDTIAISDSLWLIEEGDFFILRDSVGGDTIIEREEIPGLIQALKDLEQRLTKQGEAKND